MGLPLTSPFIIPSRSPTSGNAFCFHPQLNYRPQVIKLRLLVNVVPLHIGNLCCPQSKTLLRGVSGSSDHRHIHSLPVVYSVASSTGPKMAGAKSVVSVWVALLVCSASILAVRGADPDPLVDLAPAANGTFILRDVFKNGAVSNGPGGLRAALTTTIFPALTNEGITYVQFKMKPCGENLPHTHPRATEILTLVSGGPLQAGVVETDGTAHIYILYPGDIIVFPRGLLHFELNVGKEEAFYISALNSQNPGVLTAGGVLLKLPERALATALNQDVKTVDALKKQIYQYSDQLQMDHNSGCVPGRDITPDF